MKVFVSSTCFDLVDLRAELEAHLRDLGLQPILSDRASSEFDATVSSDSIETCLANVRAADVVVCILSQRYGPSLKAAGFDDVSATHLEWRTARDAGRPLLMYVRDRTEGEAATFKKTKKAKGDVATAWVQDPRLFDFLEEHRTLTANASRSNWIWTFRDSVELKERLSRDLKTFSSRARLLRWLDEGRAPVVRLEPGNREGHWHAPAQNTFLIGFAVRSDVAALDVRMSADNRTTWEALGDLERGNKVTKRVAFQYAATDALPLERQVLVRYSTSFGATIEDTFALRIPRDGPNVEIKLRRKEFIDDGGFEIA